MKEYKVIYIDAFTTVPFAGNPCAVLPDADGLSDDQMQAIARETNLNETSYVLPSDKATFRVRYFTPRNEIPFAGHPTIATAFLLAQEGYISLEEPVTRITLEFKIGVLPVDIIVKQGKPQRVIMTQQLPTYGMTFEAQEVSSCLGLQKEDLRTDCPSQVVSTGVPFLMVPVTGVDVLGKVKMDRDKLAKLVDKAGVPAAYLFSLGGFMKEADTHARFFDPRGTSEDPYTGSAAGAMGCYVIKYGLKKGPVLLAEQGNFVNRPGEGLIEIKGNPEKIESVQLGGAGVKVLEGKFLV
jgi:trans-2,3-dihydro-3-hydroxyanthranilate isomerase